MDSLLSRPQNAITRRIQFVRATKPDVSDQLLRSKLVPLNSISTTTPQQEEEQEGTPPTKHKQEAKEQRIDSNLIEIESGWGDRSKQGIGSGFINFGMTCYLNSTLQALTYTPPLYRLFSSSECFKFHPKCKQDPNNKNASFCMFCSLRNHILKALETTKATTIAAAQQQGIKQHSNVIAPSTIAKNLSKVCHSLRRSATLSMQDAHECLRGILDGLQKACLGQSLSAKFPPRVPPEIESSTLIHRIFGGKLLSCVKCLGCGHESRTTDLFLDLSLDIPNKSSTKSIEDCLTAFFQPERLDGTGYKCEGCNKKTTHIERSLQIGLAPLILTIHLKRFAFSKHFGGRISKVSTNLVYPLRLSLKSSTGSGSTANYNLYAVLVHEGSTAHSGHYYSFVKSPAGQWYEMDDDSVKQVPVTAALRQQSNAYILFYIRCENEILPDSVQRILLQHQQQAIPQLKIPPQPDKRGRINWIETPIAIPNAKWKKVGTASTTTNENRNKNVRAPMAIPMLRQQEEIIPSWEGDQKKPRDFSSTTTRKLTREEQMKERRRIEDEQWDAEYDAPKPAKRRKADGDNDDNGKVIDRSLQFENYLNQKKKQDLQNRFRDPGDQQQRRNYNGQRRFGGNGYGFSRFGAKGRNFHSRNQRNY